LLFRITLTIQDGISFQLISLKAELSRKQEEVIKAKAQAQAQSIHPVPRPKKHTPCTKTNAGVGERAAKDLEDTEEEEDAFKKSRCVYAKWYFLSVTDVWFPGVNFELHSLVFWRSVAEGNQENTRHINV
jgi:hypothetical protein